MKKNIYIQDKAVAKIKVNVVATIRDAATDKIKRVKKFHNIVPTVGRSAIANNLTSPSPTPSNILVNYVGVGTGTNVPANGDTQLQTEIARNVAASRTNDNNVAYVTGFFAATEAVAALKEAALFIAATAIANSGTLLSRVAINVTKSNTETLTLDWTITIS